MGRLLERSAIGVCAFGAGSLIAFAIAGVLTPDSGDLKAQIEALDLECDHWAMACDALQKNSKEEAHKQVAQAEKEAEERVNHVRLEVALRTRNLQRDLKEEDGLLVRHAHFPSSRGKMPRLARYSVLLYIIPRMSSPTC